MDNQLILIMEISGIPFISISGVFLHFIFELGRKWKPFFINHILIIDVLIFFLAIASAQLVGYKLMLLEKSYLLLDIIGFILIFVTITSFSIFSFFP